MSQVFISHSTKDRSFVEEVLVPILRDRGLGTWYSEDSIPAAVRWQESIIKGLMASDWFLLVMSANSEQSDWVKDELNWAVDHLPRGRIVPVTIGICNPYAFHIRLPRIEIVDYCRDPERALERLRAIWGKPEDLIGEPGRSPEIVAPDPGRVEPAPARPPKAEPLPTLTTRVAEIPLRLIPAGSFLMGSPEGVGENEERPQHKVTISRPFYLGIYPVTQGQYAKLTGKNPSRFAATSRGVERERVFGMDTSRFPVEWVNWYEAVNFCNALSQAEGLEPYYRLKGWLKREVEIAGGQGFRLPTEAEWEYACRAGTTSPYSFEGGEAELRHHAWFHENAGQRTHLVGEARANAFGLHDMHGNVFEWTWDGFEPNYYLRSPGVDPTGLPEAASRVIRGGSWFSVSRNCRSAFRHKSWADAASMNVGFRLARSWLGR